MRRAIYDAAQCAAVIFIATGVWGQWGWPFALIALGGLVLVLSCLDITLFRTR